MTMNKISIKALIGAAAFAVAMSVFPPEMTAQSYVPTPVTISKEKVRIDGKICYSHIVLERQTLYSISKAYNVSIDDIYRFNPTLKETGLKKNGIILIPSADAIESKSAEDHKKAEESAAQRRQEALDSLTKADDKAPVAEPRKVKRKIHTVKWFEDLDMIAQKYGVPVSALMKFNNLETRKLSSRQKLQIPTQDDINDMTAESIEFVQTETTDSNTENADSTSTETVPDNEEVVYAGKNDIKAALLLPLKATGTSSHKGNMDFYSGVLLAVSDYSEKGLDINLKVCDIAGNGLPPYNYINDCDFVIGPIAHNDMSKALEMSSETPVFISPLDHRTYDLAKSHANMIQAPTSHSVQYRDLIEWLEKDTDASDRVIFITEKGTRQTEVSAQMQAAIDSSSISYRNFSYSILEGRDIMKPLMALMTPSAFNRVVIASESEAFVNDVVRNLNLISYQKYNVVLYAPAKVRNFETIDVDNIHSTNMHASLAYFINYDDARVKNFLMKYRALYNTEPSQFAFQGYDVASYFISMVNRYGDRWMEMLEKDEQKMLQSTFRFRKTEDNGYVNNGVRRIVYGEGWSISEND